VATLTDVAQAVTAHTYEQLKTAGDAAISANTAHDSKNSARSHLQHLLDLGL
jgi:hypothetical protein